MMKLIFLLARTTVGDQAEALLGCGAMGGQVKELGACHRRLHRAAKHACADCGEGRVDIMRQLAAEAAADIASDDADILLRNMERSGETFLRARRQLRSGMDG